MWFSRFHLSISPYPPSSNRNGVEWNEMVVASRTFNWSLYHLLRNASLVQWIGITMNTLVGSSWNEWDNWMSQEMANKSNSKWWQCKLWRTIKSKGYTIFIYIFCPMCTWWIKTKLKWTVNREHPNGKEKWMPKSIMIVESDKPNENSVRRKSNAEKDKKKMIIQYRPRYVETLWQGRLRNRSTNCEIYKLACWSH